MAKGCFYSPFFVADIRSRTRQNQKTKPPTSCPKNRRFWVQTSSGESELSEKQAVLGTNPKRRERAVRKTGGFGYKLQAARASCPKNRRFWVQASSVESELSEKQAVLGTNPKRRERVVRKTGDFGYKLQAARASCPKNRRFWVQTSSGESELSEKQAVLGTNPKRHELIIRKGYAHGCFGHKIARQSANNSVFY